MKRHNDFQWYDRADRFMDAGEFSAFLFPTLLSIVGWLFFGVRAGYYGPLDAWALVFVCVAVLSAILPVWAIMGLCYAPLKELKTAAARYAFVEYMRLPEEIRGEDVLPGLRDLDIRLRHNDSHAKVEVTEFREAIKELKRAEELKANRLALAGLSGNSQEVAVLTERIRRETEIAVQVTAEIDA